MPFFLAADALSFGQDTDALDTEAQALGASAALPNVHGTWLLRSATVPGPLATLASGPITEGKHTIHLVDPYQGAWPVYYPDPSDLTSRHPPKVVRPAVLLDSNVASRFADWVNKDPGRDATKDAIFQTLLRRVVEVGADVGTFFYAVETTQNERTPGATTPHVRSAARAVMTVRTLDRKRFLDSGGVTIAVDPEAMRQLCDAYHVADREAALAHEIGLVLDGDRLRLPYMARLTQVVLLRAAIQRAELAPLPAGSETTSTPPLPADLAIQLLDEIDRVQREELGLVAARDRVLALALVSGALEDQVRPPRRGLSKKRVDDQLRDVRATSWDAALQRVPDALLAALTPTTPDEVTVMAYATMDAGLADVARAVTTRAVPFTVRGSGAHATAQASPLLTVDPSRLGTVAPAPEVLAVFHQLSAAHRASRRRGGVPASAAVSEADADRRVSELEGEYRALC